MRNACLWTWSFSFNQWQIKKIKRNAINNYTFGNSKNSDAICWLDKKTRKMTFITGCRMFCRFQECSHGQTFTATKIPTSQNSPENCNPYFCTINTQRGAGHIPWTKWASYPKLSGKTPWLMSRDSKENRYLPPQGIPSDSNYCTYLPFRELRRQEQKNVHLLISRARALVCENRDKSTAGASHLTLP
jgi:hypothetical protein